MDETKEIEGLASLPKPSSNEKRGFKDRLFSFRKPKVSTDEAKTIFEAARLEFQIKDMLDSWVGSIKPEAVERLSHFGISQEETEKVIDHTALFLKQRTHDFSTPESVNELKTKTIEILRTDNDQAVEMRTKIDGITNIYLLDLVKRKLTGEISDSERELLIILSRATRGDFSKGKHFTSSKEIELSLLNPDTLDDCRQTLHHELTHYGLNSITPDAWEGLVENFLTNTDGQTQNPNLKHFAGSITAIDESAAYRAGAYFGEKSAPPYKAYADKVHPDIFKTVYEVIDKLAEGKTIGEFDVTVAEVFKKFCANNNPDMTRDQLNGAIREFMSDCHQRSTV